MDFARPELLGSLLAGARAAHPLLLAGPPGAGKTTLLQHAAAALARQGWVPVYIDLMGAAASPEHFAAAVLDALPAQEFSARLPQALEIRRLIGSGRANGASAVRAVFSLLTSLETAAGRPVALLIDEVTEIRSLAYFDGLREVAAPFAAALEARRQGTLLATSFPSHARRLWSFAEITLPPLAAAELQGVAADPAALVRASFGWPRYAAILIDVLRDGGNLERIWAREMSLGGRLETACRHTYESLLLRSRGYGVSKALLLAVAQAEGSNLTSLYRGLGRSPGATRDYLGWLLAVDALHTVRKRYYYVDGLLRHWVRLHARGRLATAAEVEAAARAVLAPPPVTGTVAPQAAVPGMEEGAVEPRARAESLMEID